MAGRKYEKLHIEEFGKHLLKTNDLDPIYVALHGLLSSNDWHLAQRKRWLVAYWCLYHAGSACHLSQLKGWEFWKELKVAMVNTTETPVGGRWPRGHERRHLRGEQGIAVVESLKGRYTNPEEMVDYILGEELKPGETHEFLSISNRVQSHRGFGPWIGFKIADMVDRVLSQPVDFDEAAVFMFKDPIQAALRLWNLGNGLPEDNEPEDAGLAIYHVVKYLLDYFKDHTAPPLGDRPINLQEVETILCKWKSHMNGHYPLFNDIDDIQQGLTPWAKICPAAEAFQRHMPIRK